MQLQAPLSPSIRRDLMQFAHQLADLSAAVIMPGFRTSLSVTNKAGELFDPVTLADRRAESVMRAMIQERYPEHGILGEELGSVIGAGGFTWVLDPIDGTRAFITGMPLWGTLIALDDGQAPVLGIMNQPFTGERFYADGVDAWLGNRKLITRDCASFEGR